MLAAGSWRCPQVLRTLGACWCQILPLAAGSSAKPFSGWVAIFLFFYFFFSRVGCGLQLNFGGKFQRGRQAVSKSEGTGKIKHLSLFCFKILPLKQELEIWQVGKGERLRFVLCPWNILKFDQVRALYLGKNALSASWPLERPPPGGAGSPLPTPVAVTPGDTSHGMAARSAPGQAPSPHSSRAAAAGRF